MALLFSCVWRLFRFFCGRACHRLVYPMCGPCLQTGLTACSCGCTSTTLGRWACVMVVCSCLCMPVCVLVDTTAAGKCPNSGLLLGKNELQHVLNKGSSLLLCTGLAPLNAVLAACDMLNRGALPVLATGFQGVLLVPRRISTAKGPAIGFRWKGWSCLSEMQVRFVWRPLCRPHTRAAVHIPGVLPRRLSVAFFVACVMRAAVHQSTTLWALVSDFRGVVLSALTARLTTHTLAHLHTGCPCLSTHPGARSTHRGARVGILRSEQVHLHQLLLHGKRCCCQARTSVCDARCRTQCVCVCVCTVTTACREAGTRRPRCSCMLQQGVCPPAGCAPQCVCGWLAVDRVTWTTNRVHQGSRAELVFMLVVSSTNGVYHNGLGGVWSWALP